MIIPTKRWRTFSSPDASALLARSLHGPYVMPLEFMSAQAANPDQAEPLGPDDIDPVDQTDVDPEVFDEPVTGENDDQEPAPR